MAAAVSQVAARFATERRNRQQRRELDLADFAALRAAGFLTLAVPVEQTGAWSGPRHTARPLCDALRAIARADSSLALVSAMHPCVLALWLSTPRADAPFERDWDAQRRALFDSAREGAWWGTITSESGSGGDVAKTRAVALRKGRDHRLSGEKHFGSGSGVASFMLTSAIPEGESEPDWFFLDLREVPWDGTRGVKLVSEWDGHGMAATQSHAFFFDGFPVQRAAWPGQRAALSERAAPLVGCAFASVIAGIVEAAIEEGRSALAARRGSLGAYERVEWAHAELEAWLVAQSIEAMLRAVEQDAEPSWNASLGKTAIAERAETCLGHICRVVGGGTYSRRSPFGHWFEDVRALGFLRPPWGLAVDGIAEQALARRGAP